MATCRSMKSNFFYWRMHEPHDGASTPKEGDIKLIQLSHMLGAKAHSATNTRSLLWKAKGLFSHTEGCLILQKIWKAFFNMLKTHLAVSHVEGLRPILQQIWKGFRKALRVSICRSNITHCEISIDYGISASIHSAATWSATTPNFMIWPWSTMSMQQWINEKKFFRPCWGKYQRSKERKQEEKAYKHSNRNICKSEPTSTTAENKCSSWDFKASRVLRRKATKQKNSQQKQKVEINDEV